MGTSLGALNEAQRAAVMHRGGPLQILAGAGTGKTRVITHRIAALMSEGVDPREICAVTFTNKAAREMKERTIALAGAAAERATISTFHSLCARWLRQVPRIAGRSVGFSIYDSDDQLSLVKDIATSLRLANDAQACRTLQRQIEALQHEAKRVEHVQEAARGADSEELADVFAAYTVALQRANAFDFGSLITAMVHGLEDTPDVHAMMQRRASVLVVDEFQDTNPAQYALVRLLAPAGSNVAVVGDDDQSIYGWRGATVDNVFAFRNDYPLCKTIALEENYRSPPAVLAAAHSIVEKVATRMEKELFTSRTDEAPVLSFVGQDDSEEADFIARTIVEERSATDLPLHDFAVFFRTNAQARVLEERLRRGGIEHDIVGTVSFFARKEVKDLVAYLRLALNPTDDVAFFRVVNVPARGLGKTTISKVRRERDASDSPSMLDASRSVLASGKLAPRANSALRAWVSLAELLADMAQTTSPAELLETVLNETRYVELVLEKDDKAEERTQSVEELRAIADDASGRDEDLAQLLEALSLDAENTTKQANAPTTRGVQLMTVHAAKGLEFPIVFVTGLEDGQFPLTRQQDTPTQEQADEERRLAYVACTRAQQRLYLTSAQRRRLYGRWVSTEPSPFLLDVPAAIIEAVASSSSKDRKWGGASPARKSREHSFDEFDQRPWQERAGQEMGERVPEEGLVFDSVEPVSMEGPSDVGRAVTHRLFGHGEVLKSERAGDKTRLTIRFPAVGEKTVVRKFVEFLD
ncbi:MAG: DNA helicase-2/ATP-dependent DNA helicase PcrA [Flavobacteriales bacterium]|jgi:DNA helicase-2/ATP-dependent DNA helicase PcrA